MTTKIKASGLFGLKVSENGGPVETVPTTYHSLFIASNRLTVAGFMEQPLPVRGVQLDIYGELKLGEYLFTEDSRIAGFYNPNESVSSWIGEVGGKITILELDVVKQFVRGTFEFIAKDRHNPNSADIVGSFSLTNPG